MTAPDPRPLVAITMGDPAGVGPEVALKAVLDPAVASAARPLIVGDAPVLERTARILGLPVAVAPVGSPEAATWAPGLAPVLDLGLLPRGWWQPGRVDPTAGNAAVGYVRMAAELALAGRVDAIATAPLNKAAMQAAGHPYPGHTELLAHLTGTRDYAMLLVAKNLRVLHVSTHVSLAEAIARVTPERVERAIRLLHGALQDLGIPRPRIAVAGLNPHAGEGGLFGREDQDRIAPAIASCRAAGIDATGPWPADTVFYRAAHLGHFDGVVAMYHDQGHIPIKMYAFDHGVNVTVGLPIIRTSVDHGTAFDIAGQGVARATSMVEAVRLAAQMAQARRARHQGAGGGKEDPHARQDAPAH